MEHNEESHARDLYYSLVTRCHPGTEVTVDGAGVHWHCSATRVQRTCSIACFDRWEEVQGPEYLVCFKHGAEEKATGRTTSKPDAVAAVVCWLDEYSVEELHRLFAFIDAKQKALAAIEKTVIQRCPELEQGVTHALNHIVSDLYELWFKAQSRSCRISFYGDNPLPDCAFHWDESELFRFQTDDLSQLSMVLKRWLRDYAMPSQMRSEFPWINIDPLADHYEAGRAVEGEFITSWDRIERFYQAERFPFAALVLHFISEIRQAGFDKKLRAGQSLYSLVVSRSRRHGLQTGQPSIAFRFRNGGMDVYVNVDGSEGEDKSTFSKIEFTREVASLLQRLADKDVD